MGRVRPPQRAVGGERRAGSLASWRRGLFTAAGRGRPQLAMVRDSRLTVVDASTGRQTDLGDVVGDVTSSVATPWFSFSCGVDTGSRGGGGLQPPLRRQHHLLHRRGHQPVPPRTRHQRRLVRGRRAFFPFGPECLDPSSLVDAGRVRGACREWIGRTDSAATDEIGAAVRSHRTTTRPDETPREGSRDHEADDHRAGLR